jgi:hypothetical protein
MLYVNVVGVTNAWHLRIKQRPIVNSTTHLLHRVILVPPLQLANPPGRMRSDQPVCVASQPCVPLSL